MEHKVDTAKIESAFRQILEAIGEDPNREGVANTPAEWPVCTRRSLAGCKRIRANCWMFPLPSIMMN